MDDDQLPDFSISLDALERSAHVPVDEQVTEHDETRPPMPEEDANRQNTIRWAGGAALGG